MAWVNQMLFVDPVSNKQGRIERQGNMFPEVDVYRYVTEQTFEAYRCV